MHGSSSSSRSHIASFSPYGANLFQDLPPIIRLAMKASIPASQRQFCSACGDVSRNILRIITSELDVRTSKGKDEYTWECDISTITQTARGCTFCRFVKYVFLKPYYDPQSLKAVPWRSASNVKDLTEEELSTLRYLVARGGSACAICENTIFTGAGGVCYLCKPRLVRYLATEEHRFDVHASWTLPFQLTFQKACWAVDENADMEGLAITTTSKQPLDTNDQLFRVDCLDGTISLRHAHSHSLMKIDTRE